MDKMNNGSFDVDVWNNEYARRYILSTVLQSLYLVLGVCGNLTAIIIYTTKMHSKHDDRYFIPFLASVDLSGCVVSTSLILIENNLPYKYPNTAICKFLNVTACGLIVGSIFLLLVISIQRYQKICRPFHYQMNLRCKRIVASLVLCLAVAFAFPTIFLYEKVEVVHPSTNVTGHRCGPVPNTEAFGEIYRGIVIAAELISVVGMSVLYGFVGYTLVTKMKPTKKANPNEMPNSSQTTNMEKTTGDTNVSESVDTSMDSRFHEKDGKALKRKKENIKYRTGKQYSLMFMSISLVSILCFFPPWIFVLLETKDKTFWNHLSYEQTQIFVIIRGIFVLNFVVNPFIYCFFDSKFKHNVYKYLTCK